MMVKCDVVGLLCQKLFGYGCSYIESVRVKGLVRLNENMTRRKDDEGSKGTHTVKRKIFGIHVGQHVIIFAKVQQRVCTPCCTCTTD
jgi:hypothetical protein